MKISNSSKMYKAKWRQLAVASLCCVTSIAWAAGKTYTLDADFAQGALDGVNYDAPNGDQLQLNAVGTTFPVAWIANAGEDTVSKFDTNLNKEVARYRTWFGPAGQPGHFNHLGNAYSGPAPSRTAVDINGNAYVLNRHFNQGVDSAGVVLKILAEGFIDRNANGVMDTSADSNDDGIIDDSEMLPLADSNGNGIPDYLDNMPTSNILPQQGAVTNAFLIECDPGVRCGLGKFALNGESGGVQILDEEVGASAELIIDPTFEPVGGIFDFVINDLPTPGQSVRIVIPQIAPIPANAVYRKFQNGAWVNFMSNANNSIFSAPEINFLEASFQVSCKCFMKFDIGLKFL